MENPKEYHYSKEHTWIQVNGSEGIIGITHFAQSELGEIVYVDVPNLGDDFEQNDVFGSVEALKTVSDLFMPVSGEIITINEKLADNPELVNERPFDKGWIVKIKIENPKELDSLLSAQDYSKAILQEDR